MAYAPDTTLCLIDFEDGIYDVTGKSSVNNNGTTLTSDQHKYSSSSAYFNNSESDNILIQLPSEAQTVSLWFYPIGNNSSGWYPTIWSSQTNSNAGGTYTHVDDGAYGAYPIFRVNAKDSGTNNGSAGSKIISRDTWHHYAYCNQGDGTHKFFLDGVLQATVTQSNPNELTTMSLGGLLNSSSGYVSGCYYSGYIGELLVTSNCLYTDDFDVPTEGWQWSAPVVPPTSVESETNYGTYSGSITNITDGDEDTYWWTNQAQSESQLILFTFNKPVLFNGLTALTKNNTGDCISSGTVLQTSEDGNTWNTVGQFTGEPECTFSNLNIDNVSYVRIYVETSSNKWLCINEITLDYEEIVNQKMYIKASNSWQLVTKIYKKVNGTWVAQENIERIFDDDINYIASQV